MITHVCPSCGQRHDVHPILDRLAYGAQLACSARCKVAYRRAAVERCRAEGEQDEPDGRRRSGIEANGG